MNFLRSPYSYATLEKEDPAYVSHRKAQFLIYKTMKEFELRKRRRCRIRKLKSKLNARMRKFGAAVWHVLSQIKHMKKLLLRAKPAMAPIKTLQG